MSKPLSICIPTYNRAPFLDEALRSIAAQRDLSQVQVVISDNASSDDTQAVVERWQAVLPDVVYYRWNENQGADRNFLNVIEIASGQYCWLLGSDDQLTDDAVGRLLPYLTEASLLLVDFDLMSFDMQSVRQNRQTLSAKAGARFTIQKEEDFREYLACAKDLTSFFAYISTVVVRRSDWVATPTREEFIGSAWIHVTKALDILRTGGTLKYVGQKLILNRSGNDSFLADVGFVRRMLIDLDYIRICKRVLAEQPIMQSLMLSWLARWFFSWRAVLAIRCALAQVDSGESARRVESVLFPAFAGTPHHQFKHWAWKFMPIHLLNALRNIDRWRRLRQNTLSTKN